MGVGGELLGLGSELSAACDLTRSTSKACVKGVVLSFPARTNTHTWRLYTHGHAQARTPVQSPCTHNTCTREHSRSP